MARPDAGVGPEVAHAERLQDLAHVDIALGRIAEPGIAVVRRDVEVAGEHEGGVVTAVFVDELDQLAKLAEANPVVPGGVVGSRDREQVATREQMGRHDVDGCRDFGGRRRGRGAFGCVPNDVELNHQRSLRRERVGVSKITTRAVDELGTPSDAQSAFVDERGETAAGEATPGPSRTRHEPHPTQPCGNRRLFAVLERLGECDHIKPVAQRLAGELRTPFDVGSEDPVAPGQVWSAGPHARCQQPRVPEGQPQLHRGRMRLGHHAAGYRSWPAEQPATPHVASRIDAK